MRHLTQKEIDQAPEWADEYCILEDGEGVGYVNYIGGNWSWSVGLDWVSDDDHNDLIDKRSIMQFMVRSKEGAVEAAKHFKLTAEELK